MKRYSEVVLNGHPDKFCDLVADRLIREIYKTDLQAYAQIEVSVWSDIIFLSGGVVTKKKLEFSVSEIIYEVGFAIGYTAENYIDVKQYKIMDHICWVVSDPGKWTNYSNDQSIVVGYAGYDNLTRYLPPEHFLCWYFREALITSMMEGALKNQGPDGKILIVMNEENSQWRLNTVLITLQQKESFSFLDFTDITVNVLRAAYQNLQTKDLRWSEEWKDVKVLINPNGPLLNGGSDGDNGQTGRKLVMDYYGPRIPIGGGALYGKDLSHIDRIGAFAARRFALNMVKNGSREATVIICFAPGMNEPLSIDIASDKRPHVDAEEYFLFSCMKERIDLGDMNYNLRELGSFYNQTLSFNSNIDKAIISQHEICENKIIVL